VKEEGNMSGEKRKKSDRSGEGWNFLVDAFESCLKVV